MFGFRFWSLSALYAAGSALLLGVPTRLIPTPLFSRVVPTGPQDYVVWVVSTLLLGPLFALMTLYPMPSPKATPGKRSIAGTGRAFGGALLSFFSVGCPVCNKVVVLLGVTLFLRVRVVRYGCHLPVQKTVANEEG